ncbi:unnamed protein product, partial [Rotaria magnacalcarata]
MVSYFSNWWKGKLTISESASQFGHVFESNDVGMKFFDSILQHSITFDELIEQDGKTLLQDIDYITQCATTDLTAKESSDRPQQRIDAYLYVHRRMQEYVRRINKDYPPLKKLEEHLFDLLKSTFKETKGQEPNLIVE